MGYSGILDCLVSPTPSSRLDDRRTGFGDKGFPGIGRPGLSPSGREYALAARRWATVSNRPYPVVRHRLHSARKPTQIIGTMCAATRSVTCYVIQGKPCL